MKNKSERCEVPIAAIIDIVFLLLVYFIVTSTHVVDEAYVQVNLPGPGPSNPIESMDVYVLKDHYELMGKKYSLEEMDNYLSQISQIMEDIPVNIKISKQAEHQKLVRLLDSLNKVKVTRFSLHTLK
ncbi:MAG: biopolymer transporter ExbD [Lentisphaeraceae bacterium]|nr:biopolymer transporter ExbD [Lentisphaeraceae bacterium]